MSETKAVTAAVLVIGDEILSGRTQDTNTNYIARFLAALGIDLKEARVVGDVEDEIVAALTKRYEDEAVQRHADTLRNLPIEANPELVASLRTRYGEAPSVPEPGAQKPARP